ARAGGKETRDVAEFMGAAGAQRKKEWTSSTPRAQLSSVLDRARKAAMEEDWAPITAGALDGAIDAMARGRAKAAEQMSAPAFKRLPPSAREGPRQRVECVKRMGAWPWHMLIAPVSLSRKEVGGDRAIGLLPEAAKPRSKVRRKHPGEWAKVHAATALWDLAGFYDVSEPVLIFGEGVRLGLPARTWHLEMLRHLSSRASGKLTQVHARSQAADVTARSSKATGRPGDEAGAGELKAAPADAIEQEQWAKAAGRNAGKGSEDGADLHSARGLPRRLKKQGRFDKVGATRAIFAGCIWPRQRVADTRVEIGSAMRLGRSGIILEREKSKRSGEKADEGVEIQPHLRPHGSLAKSGAQAAPPPEPGEELRGLVGEPRVDINGRAHAAGDASRGETTDAPRREAMVEALEHLHLQENIKYTTDFSYVARGAHRIRMAKLPKTHKDLRKRHREAAKLKEIAVAKVEGRVSATDAVEAGVGAGGFAGNHLADELARGIAAEVQAPQTRRGRP
ncbi:unnamed protein product, partial [Prorocentrum cordatum]